MLIIISSLLLLIPAGGLCNYDLIEETKNVPIHKEGLQQTNVANEIVTVTIKGANGGIADFLKKVMGPAKCSEEIVCKDPFVSVAGGCLLVDTSVDLNWKQSRTFCQERGSDLATFKDIKEFSDIIQYLKFVNSNTNYWLGGSDEILEDNWVFVDGSPMPMGSPFWGTIGGSGKPYILEPNGARGENCAFFYARDHFYIHDLNCVPSSAGWVNSPSPVCRYYP